METSFDEEELESPENKEFVSYLGLEIDDFLKTNGNSNCIMLFPPFNSYRRLLTHHFVELNYSKCGLSTFSIGEEPRRRTVVCLGSLRKGLLNDDDESKIQKNRPNSSFTERSYKTTPSTQKPAELDNENHNPGKNTPVERQRKVRKTINYYVPPHMRKTSVSEPVVKKKRDVLIDGDLTSEDTIEDTRDKVESSNNETTLDSEPVLSSHTTSNEPSSDELSENKGVWDPLYCGRGLCSFSNVVIPILNETEMSDISKEVGTVKVVEVKGPVLDKSSEGNEYVNSTIIEIYDLPEDMKADELAKLFEEYIKRGFRLRFVDESHALGIFSSAKVAEEALSAEFSRIKIRPIAQGTLLSQEIARNVVLPSSFRPKTCSSLAKRLLSGALGLKVSPMSTEEREAAQRKRQECKDQRKKAIA